VHPYIQVRFAVKPNGSLTIFSNALHLREDSLQPGKTIGNVFVEKGKRLTPLRPIILL
jgi:hypothetical protein